ncbi:sensor histidine kinase [Murimonas intestini]|nr:ATP-binding protein [Murimonas intestini]
MVLDRDDNMLTISIQSVRKDDKDWLEFSIEDNGASITPEELKTLEEKLSQPVLSRDEDNGFALSNVNSRLKLVFGEESRLHPQVGSQGKGFRIVFAIPPVLPEDLQ